MKFMDRLLKPKALNSYELSKMINWGFGGGSTSAGISVNNESAMRQATVFSCINILSRTAGQIPCHYYQIQGKNRNKATEDPIYALLHDMPNEWMTAPEFWGMAMNHLPCRGNFYALKVKVRGEVKELIPLAPGIVNEVIQLPSFKLVYKCTYPDGTRVDIPGSEIMHLRGMVLNGFMGMNPIEYIRESIGLGMATERFGARNFGSGTHPSMILTAPGKVNDPKTFLEATSEVYGGLGNSHRLMLLENGITANNVSIKPEDSQYLDTRKYQKSEIVDIFFGMPLTVMGTGETTPTYASAEQFSINFVIYAIMPWLVNIEKGIYRDLIPQHQKADYYAKFNVRALQRASFKEQMDALAVAIDKEIFNPNEARELLEYNPYSGGDEYRTRTSTVNKPSEQGAPK
jgi:HK97 family phage portal protein